MLAAPPAVDHTENARAAITERAEEIVADTKRDVDDELARMEAAKQWAFAEMDRITARAEKELDEGKDPDDVERRMRADLDATIARAGDPEFDPRTKAAAEEPAGQPAIPEAAVPEVTSAEATTSARADGDATSIADAPSPAPSIAPAPSVAPAPAPSPATTDVSSCTCKAGRSTPPRPLRLIAAMVLFACVMRRRQWTASAAPEYPRGMRRHRSARRQRARRAAPVP